MPMETLISSWCNEGNPDKAFLFIFWMTGRGFPPNKVVSSKIVSKLYKVDRINKVTMIQDKMVDFDLLKVDKYLDKFVKNGIIGLSLENC